MGHVQDKYTRTYFTKTNPDGSVAGYGVEGYEEFMEGKIRDTDLKLLNRLEFSDRRVLEFGFGRGEAIKYSIENGVGHYEGVDFSENAIAIATEFLEKHDLAVPSLHHSDALSYLREYVPIHKDEKRQNFDIVLMLDFVEHVPREEVSEIMTLLRDILSESAVVAINTPAFRIDNDVIRDGLSPLNNVDTIDKSDLIEETAEMHCNKYTIISLHEFMASCGFKAISEAHFYVPVHSEALSLSPLSDFRSLWEWGIAQGVPLSPDWIEDHIEYAYQRSELPKWHTFTENRLKDISLLITEIYQQYFPAGEYDAELFEDIEKCAVDGKIIFDLGGFMGASSLLFARLVGASGRVLCFEPNPWNCQRIRSNLSRNPSLANNVSLFSIALGDCDGAMEMLLSDNVDSGYSSTSQSVSSHGTLPKDHLVSLGFYTQTVTVKTIDNFVSETGVIPDIIKVDIEGAEHLFLSGAEETIREHSPTIYMEVHSPFCAWQCSQKLQRMGYILNVLFEEEDGRLMIKAEHNGVTSVQMDSDVMNRELLDMLRLDRICHERSLRSTQKDLQSTQKDLQSTQQDLQTTQQDLQRAQQDLQKAQQELGNNRQELMELQSSLAAAMRVIEHPCVKIQLTAWRTIKRIFKK